MIHARRAVIISACCYGFAHIFPVYCWWMITIFLIPIFYKASYNRLTILDGLIWAICAFAIHLSGVLQGLFLIAQGSLYARIIPPIAVLLLACFYVISWFALSCKLSHYLHTPSQRLFLWTITTVLFFLWMEHGALFLLGVLEGYLFFSPLVPLVQFPVLLYFLSTIPSYILVALFVLTQASIVGIFLQSTIWNGVGICCLFYWITTMFCASFFPVSHNYRPINNLLCSTIFFPAYDNISLNGRLLRDYAKKILETHKNTQILFLPESAVRCPYVIERPHNIDLLHERFLGNPLTIIAGGFRWDDDIYRNTVYWIHNGVLIDFFDKRHAMALTERAPSEFFLGKSSFLKRVYFQTMVGIVPHFRQRPVWKISENLTIIPYICSELFFNASPDHAIIKKSTDPMPIIVALCNDAWLESSFMRYQMLMGAQYRAIQWNIPIMYIAYYHQVLCLPCGAMSTLHSIGR